MEEKLLNIIPNLKSKNHKRDDLPFSPLRWAKVAGKQIFIYILGGIINGHKLLGKQFSNIYQNYKRTHFIQNFHF